MKDGLPVKIRPGRTLIIETPGSAPVRIHSDTKHGRLTPRVSGPPGTTVRYEAVERKEEDEATQEGEANPQPPAGE